MQGPGAHTPAPLLAASFTQSIGAGIVWHKKEACNPELVFASGCQLCGLGPTALLAW